MPKSVKSPVKCVVLTVDLDIFVTKAFWIPMPKSIEKAISFPSIEDKLACMPKKPTVVKIAISNEIGIICGKSGRLIATNSARKLDVKAPIKKKRVKTKKLIAAA